MCSSLNRASAQMSADQGIRIRPSTHQFFLAVSEFVALLNTVRFQPKYSSSGKDPSAPLGQDL